MGHEHRRLPGMVNSYRQPHFRMQSTKSQIMTNISDSSIMGRESPADREAPETAAATTCHERMGGALLRVFQRKTAPAASPQRSKAAFFKRIFVPREVGRGIYL